MDDTHYDFEEVAAADLEVLKYDGFIYQARLRDGNKGNTVYYWKNGAWTVSARALDDFTGFPEATDEQLRSAGLVCN